MAGGATMEPEREIVEDGLTRQELRAKLWEGVRENPGDSAWIASDGMLWQATVDEHLPCGEEPRAGPKGSLPTA
jgi:hypothetical protein